MKLFLLFAGMLISGIANGQPTAPQRTLTPPRSHMLLQFAKNPSQALLEKLAPCIAVTALTGWYEVTYIFPGFKELTAGIPARACASKLASEAPVEQAIPVVAPALDPASPLVLAVIAPLSSTTVPSISISGTASGGSDTVEVSWTSSNGTSGVAQGSSNWIIPTIPLSVGSNVITIGAEDSLVNVVTSGVTVSYQPVSPTPNPPSSPDATPPSLTILTPATSNYSTSAGSLVVNGTASDNVGVASVSWATSNGDSGTATGTSNWSTPAIALYIGSTTIVITASDAAGNTTWRSLTVTRE
jgi:hypothetical protein